jgi:hypothetical protein
MVYSDSSGKPGIIEDIDYLIGTNSSSYTIEDKTRNINRKYDEVVSLILQSDATWKWDDTNNGAQPATSITMTGGTNAVAIPDTTYLTISRVEIKDINGNYVLLTPIQDREILQAKSEFFKTDGMPIYYEKNGAFLNLYPAPASGSVTLTNGLLVYYQRNASYFATSDTTKVPGFAAPYHRLLSYGAALDFAIANSLNGKINILSPLIQKMEQGLVEFYSNRSKDEKVRFNVRREVNELDGGYGLPDNRL